MRNPFTISYFLFCNILYYELNNKIVIMKVRICFNEKYTVKMTFKKDAVKLLIKFQSFFIEYILCTYPPIKKSQ